MSRIEKTISFRAEDNGTSAIVNKLRQETETYRNSILKTALDSTTSSKEFVRSIEDQIKALERRQKLVSQINREQVREKYSDAINDVRANVEYLESERNRGSARVSQETLDKAKEEASRNITSLMRERDLELGGLNKEDDIQIKLLRELIESVKENATVQIIENRKEAEKNATLSSRGKLDNEDEITRAEAKYQELMLLGNRGEGQDGGRGTGWQEVFKGVLASEIVKGIASLGANMAGARTGDYAFAQMFSAIPLVGGAISTALTRHLEQQQERDLSSNLLRGTSGRGGTYGNTGLGLDSAEGTRLAMEIAKTRGFRGNIGNDVNEIYSTSRAFNIDQSTLMNAESRRLYDSTGGAMGGVSTLLNALRSSGVMGEDTSKLAKLMEIQNSLTQEQLQITEKVDGQRVSQVIAAFQAVGGRFSDPNRAGQAIAGINSSLKGAGNDYQQAMNYAVLNRLNPGGSFLDIKMMEEQGVYTPGYLKEYMSMLDQQGGGGDSSIWNTYLRFKDSGLSISGAKYLYENRDQFNDEFNVDQTISRANIMARGSGNVTDVERRTARINDAFAESAVMGVTEAMTQTFVVGAQEFQKMLSPEFWRESGAALGGSFNDIVGGTGLGKMHKDVSNKTNEMVNPFGPWSILGIKGLLKD